MVHMSLLGVLSCHLSIVSDPLHAVKHRSRRAADHPPLTTHPRSPQNYAEKEKNEKLMRERSIKSNRRHKFVDCLSAQDVNIGALERIPFSSS